MKIKIMSDLHMEFGSNFVLEEGPQDTVLVLAGDIHVRASEFEKFIARWHTSFKKILFVAGNHEFYKTEFWTLHDEMLAIDDKYKNFIYLNMDTVKIDGVNFIGCTGWPAADVISWQCMSDSKLIRIDKRPFTSFDLDHWNKKHVEYIKYQLRNVEGEKIVITHFGPDDRLCDEYWKGNSLNDYFWLNNFDKEDFALVDTWIFGHTHSSCDEVIDTCRCVCNPYGYIGHSVNQNFEGDKTL